MRPPFRVVAADPAWRFGDRLRMSKVRRGADAQYATMTVDEIAALPVPELVDDDAVLLLWRPSSFAAAGLRVLDAWGFRQVQEVVWYKVRPSGVPGFGMGRLFRAAKEVAFVGARGSLYRHLQRRNVRDVFVAPPLPHSRKPECVQDALDTMFPEGARLELFARRDRPGWACVGNETPSTFGRDLREVLAEMVAGRAAA